MDAVILTEFVDNKAAAALYRRLGFMLDKVVSKLQACTNCPDTPTARVPLNK